MNATTIAIGILAGTLLMSAILSFRRVATLEIALDYNLLSQQVGDDMMTPGLHFMGAPWHFLIKYPKTMQNMQFSSAVHHDELHCRTLDGLQVILEVSFQYQFIPDEARELFADFGQSYESVFSDVAQHLVGEVATFYSAYQFFNAKETIAAKMQQEMDVYFRKHLHATIISLQIQSSQLPDSFNQAITNTVTQRQNITNAQKYLDQMTVQLETNVIIAEKDANATVSAALGLAEKIVIEAETKSKLQFQNGEAEAVAYKQVKQRLGLSNDQLLEYIWWDMVGSDGAAGSSILVGLNPSTFIAGPGGGGGSRTNAAPAG